MPVYEEQPEQRNTGGQNNGTFEGLFKVQVIKATEMVKLISDHDLDSNRDSYLANQVKYWKLQIIIKALSSEFENKVNVFARPSEFNSNGDETRKSTEFKINRIYESFGLDYYKSSDDDIFRPPCPQMAGKIAWAIFYRKEFDNPKGYFTDVYDWIVGIEKSPAKLIADFWKRKDGGWLKLHASSSLTNAASIQIPVAEPSSQIETVPLETALRMSNYPTGTPSGSGPTPAVADQQPLGF